MTKFRVAAAVCAAFAAGMLLPRPVQGVQAASMAVTSPTQGWTLHVDAQKHFSAHPTEIAHHWCKAVSNGLTECQIYRSDAPNAQLVAVETIVGPATYQGFSKSEQAVWHYHKVEIPKVHATLPGLTPAQARKVLASISNTYGKIWVLFDPMQTGDMPTGNPTITVLK